MSFWRLNGKLWTNFYIVMVFPLLTLSKQMPDKQFPVIHFKSQTAWVFRKDKFIYTTEIGVLGRFPIDTNSMITILYIQRIINMMQMLNCLLQKSLIFSTMVCSSMQNSEQLFLIRDQGPSCLYITSFQLRVWRDKVLSSLNICKRCTLQ